MKLLFKINFKLPCISAYANLKFALSLMASFAFLSSSLWNLDRDGWTFCWILLLCFGFCFLLVISFFLFSFSEFDNCGLFVIFRVTYRMDLVFMNSHSSIPASRALTEIALLLSSSFVSSFPGFQRPVTIMHNLQGY